MKISMIQMDMRLGNPDYNFAHAKELIAQAVKENRPDVITLPETWNTGFFPKTNLEALCDHHGMRVQEEIGSLAAEFKVNIVAGSVANVKDGGIYNTAYIFDRHGKCAATYDKTHLFSPMKEDDYFKKGRDLCTFMLDSVSCGLVICYDIRFCELVRALALKGIEVLFVVAQWPGVRAFHWETLNTARAIENQIFLSCTNSCGIAGETTYAGLSAIIDPWGNTVKKAGEGEEIITADIDLGQIQTIRDSIHVFRDRRPELYSGTLS